MKPATRDENVTSFVRRVGAVRNGCERTHANAWEARFLLRVPRQAAALNGTDCVSSAYAIYGDGRTVHRRRHRSRDARIAALAYELHPCKIVSFSMVTWRLAALPPVDDEYRVYAKGKYQETKPRATRAAANAL
ncbi:hypothetical protein MRX96_007502 [Rhipicephalus microplus]